MGARVCYAGAFTNQEEYVRQVQLAFTREEWNLLSKDFWFQQQLGIIKDKSHAERLIAVGHMSLLRDDL